MPTRPQPPTEAFFATCPRGLEACLAQELTALQASYVSATDGGVAFSGPLILAYHANLESRLASRILWRVGHGRCRDERELYGLVHGLPWARHFDVGRTLRVDVTGAKSPLPSLEFATLRIKDAICDRFRAVSGLRPSIDKERPDVRVQAFLGEREATIYLDTSGEALFKRGYRRATDAAPLRENLAAGLIALSGWTPGTPFLDPMCGSGTIAVEAALMAADRAPGLTRSFGFQKLSWYDGPTWQRIRQRAHDRVRPAPDTATIHARDIDPRIVAIAEANLASAGVDGFVATATADMLTNLAPAGSGVLIANPPYGVRLDDDAALAAFYPRLGDTLKQCYPGWIAWLFSGDARLPKLIGLKPSRRIPLYNGALECRFYRFELVTGRPVRSRATDVAGFSDPADAAG